MKEMLFLVDWGGDKRRAWSGTCWGLYCALQKHFNLIEVKINASIIEKFIHKILRIILRSDGMGLYSIITQRRKNTVKIQKISGIKTVFQFSEIVVDSSNINTYIYIDEHVNNVKLLYEHDRSTFDKSLFRKLDYHSICRRNKSQLNYLKCCAGIFTMGLWQKKSLIENLNIPEEKVHHVGGGINVQVDRIDYSLKQRNKILFVGRDLIGKGGILVLEAFRLLKQKYPNVELHIAGPASIYPYENTSGVYHYGFVSRDKVSQLMNLCDVFCMPSYYEAYGMVFIEALTYGLPCIGRNAYEMPHFIEDGKTGLLIDSDDVRELSSKMAILLNDYSYTERVRLKRDWYVDNYSWQTVADRIDDIITSDLMS